MAKKNAQNERNIRYINSVVEFRDQNLFKQVANVQAIAADLQKRKQAQADKSFV